MQIVDGGEDYVADDADAPGADFVERVLARMPVAELYVIIQVDDVHGSHVARGEGQVIVLRSRLARNKYLLIAELGGRGPHKIYKPSRRIRVAFKMRILLTNHIGKDQSLDVLELIREGHARGQFARAVGIVVVLIPVHKRLFAIHESNPDSEALLFRA